MDSLSELIHNVQVRVKLLRGRNVLTFTIRIPFGLKHTPHPPTLVHTLTHRAASKTPHHSKIRKAPSNAAASEVCCIAAGEKQPIFRKLSVIHKVVNTNEH